MYVEALAHNCRMERRTTSTVNLECHTKYNLLTKATYVSRKSYKIDKILMNEFNSLYIALINVNKLPGGSQTGQLVQAPVRHTGKQETKIIIYYGNKP